MEHQQMRKYFGKNTKLLQNKKLVNQKNQEKFFVQNLIRRLAFLWDYEFKLKVIILFFLVFFGDLVCSEGKIVCIKLIALVLRGRRQNPSSKPNL